MELEVGISGSGNSANYHLNALSSVKGIETTAIAAEKFSDIAELVARSPRIKAYDEIVYMIEDGSIDAIVFLNNLRLRKRDILMALEAGLYVIAEQPLSRDAREAKALLDVAEEEGLYLVPVLDVAYTESVKRLREWRKGSSEPFKGKLAFNDPFYFNSHDMLYSDPLRLITMLYCALPELTDFRVDSAHASDNSIFATISFSSQSKLDISITKESSPSSLNLYNGSEEITLRGKELLASLSRDYLGQFYNDAMRHIANGSDLGISRRETLYPIFIINEIERIIGKLK